MAERVALVTGSTDGIGRQTARALAAAGMKVIVHGRSKPKVDATLAELREELPGGELEGVSFDLGTLAGGAPRRRAVLERVAEAPRARQQRRHLRERARRSPTTASRLTFAVNYLGPFLLTELLGPRLTESAEGGPASRVINVASVAHTRGRIHFDDLQLADSVDGLRRVRAVQARAGDARDDARRSPRAVEAARVQPASRRRRRPSCCARASVRSQGIATEAGAKTSVMLAGGARPRTSRRAATTATASRRRRVDRRAMREAREQLWDLSVQLAKV